MDVLFAVLAFLASLLGFEGDRDTVVQRIAAPASQVLWSRTTVQAGWTRFECLRSGTGHCHYLVLPRTCPGNAACTARRYDVAVGTTRQVAAQHGARICVSIDASRSGTAAACGNDAPGGSTRP